MLSADIICVCFRFSSFTKQCKTNKILIEIQFWRPNNKNLSQKEPSTFTINTNQYFSFITNIWEIGHSFSTRNAERLMKVLVLMKLVQGRIALFQFYWTGGNSKWKFTIWKSSDFVLIKMKIPISSEGTHILYPPTGIKLKSYVNPKFKKKIIVEISDFVFNSMVLILHRILYFCLQKIVLITSTQFWWLPLHS